MNYRDSLKDKSRIVVKIGSSSLVHKNTGYLDLSKLEKLVRVLTNLRNTGKDVVLVSSGAIAVGRKKIGLEKTLSIPEKQACAAIGQAQLMMMYQKLFSEYNQVAAQVLMTKVTMINEPNKTNAINTFNQLLSFGVIPVVNENDTVSTYEIQFGDNDRLSAIVATLVSADLLILLSDIDGLFTDDPNTNKSAKLIKEVECIDEQLESMGKNTSSSDVGTGGMSAKIGAAKIATKAGTDMVIANGDDILNIERIINGEDVGTLFVANKDDKFNLAEVL